MNTIHQSPEQLAQKRPEIRGGAAEEAILRVKIIAEAVLNVINATKYNDNPEFPDLAATASEEVEHIKEVTIDASEIDRALAAVIAAHENPEAGFSNIGA